ncbi:Uncharacterised protein g6594 [Pycnogonum litorale]
MPTYTVSDGIEALGFGYFHLKLTVILGFIWMGEGIEYTVTSLLGPELKCKWQLTPVQITILTVATHSGMMVGSAFIGKMADLYGRKKTMLLFVGFLTYYGFLSALSNDLISLLIVRFIFGIYLSSVYGVVPLLLEYTPIKYRSCVVFALLIPYSVGGSFELLMSAFVLPTLGWKPWIVLSSLPFLIVVGCFIFFVPESLRFLSVTGQKSEMLKILNIMSIDNKRQLPDGDFQLTPVAERGNIKDLFQPKLLKRTILFTIYFTSTLLVYNGMLLILPFLYHSDNDKQGCTLECENRPTSYYLGLMKTASMELLASPASFIMVEKLGRRYTLMISQLAVAVILFAYVVSDRYVIILFGVARIFASIAVTCAYIYNCEIYPTYIRGVAVGFVTSCGRIGMIILIIVVQYLQLTYPRIAVIVIMVTAIVGGLSAIFLPETKDTQMEDIADLRNSEE